jgi:phosphoglycolate phosphatase-like HAD superfamily hydrolase
MIELQELIFDWGDTVMRVFPDPTGPMADWPEVAAVPGIGDALTVLAPRYRLALATNAGDSGGEQVRAALRRVHLDAFFSAVITSREIGARKPALAFFDATLNAIGCAPGEAAMIGDDYAADVVGAKAAGLRAIWFNPGRRPCPEPHPAYDAELGDMARLPEALGTLRLPDIATCLAWLREQGATNGLVAHVRLVAATAFRLAERLHSAGVLVDPLLAHRGGLLHDLAKASARATGAAHDRLAGELLRARGHGDLAAIAERHAVWALLDPAKRPETWEEKLVCYADRLADGSRLVTVDERMDALIARRPELAPDLERYRAAAEALEREIARRLGLTAGEMFEQLKIAAL